MSAAASKEPSGEERPARQRLQRRPGRAARRWVGRVASPPGVPIGRLSAALRPEGGEEPRGCSGAGAGEPGRADAGRTRDPAPPLQPPCTPPPPSSSRALAPTVGLRQRPGRTRAAPRRPGEWPRATCAPPEPRSLLWLSRPRHDEVCPGGARDNEEGRGRVNLAEEKWDRHQEVPPAPRSRMGTGGAGPGALCSGREGYGSRRPRLPPAAPSLPCSPGGRSPGRLGNRAGVSPGMCLWGQLGSREERRWPWRPGNCGRREVARGLRGTAGRRGCFQPGAFRPGEGLHSSAAPGGGGWVGVCA